MRMWMKILLGIAALDLGFFGGWLTHIVTDSKLAIGLGSALGFLIGMRLFMEDSHD